MRYTLITFGLLAIFSCTNDNIKIVEYYDTGEKKATIDKDSILTEYYKDSNIKAFGKISNNKKNGNWIDYYPDGSIKWQGNCINNIRECILIDSFIKIIKIDNTDYFHLGTSNYIRIKVNNISQQDLFPACSNGLIRWSDNPNYDYVIMPKRKGKLFLTIFANIDDQKKLLKRLEYEVK